MSFNIFANIFTKPKKTKGRKPNTKALKDLSLLNSKQIPKYRKNQLKEIK